MDRLVRYALRATVHASVALMVVASAHAWLIRAPDDPRLSERQQVAARLLPPYAAWLLFMDAYHALTYPPAVREALRYCVESLQARGYAEWTRVATCECHALEGESLDACFARH